ncbi:MAG: ATP-dependent DNA helicase RecG [Bacilli bacterium]|nr:ATP-dependent DNA helicase RecG [Bacilli bacterium]MBP3635460.1 ATP-dependent DNA helicase RecG [Bacilli bacterium]
MMQLKDIKGIGPKTIEVLNRLNISNVNDLTLHYPFRYEVLKQTSLYEDKVIVSGIIESTVTLSFFKKMNRLSFKLNVNNKLINVVIFNRGFLKNNLIIGNSITVIGKYDEKSNKIIASDIKLFNLGNSIIIEPIYHSVKGINSRSLNKIINIALDSSLVVDYIPKYISDKYDFIDKKKALDLIHNPKNLNNMNKALERCKYEELFLFMLKINALKRRNNNLNVGYKKDINMDKINEFIKDLPFELTIDQLNALSDIFNDLKEEKRMNRLIEGDVGSGKTIVSIISMYAMCLCNYQSALMVPTEVLAKQHYKNIVGLFEKYNINVELLVGSMKKKEKEEAYERIKSGESNIIIGTHAIITDDIIYNNLGLVITDEQHRFGVNQRNSLRNKGNMPDVLYMSATPIPRTYALTIYGDMDISIINSMPNGRKKVITKVVDSKDIKKVLYKIKEELDNNHQIYIISPLIEEADDEEEDIQKLERKFKLAFKNYNVGILHGKMTSKEKDKIMEDYINKKIDILISTTVIEVGVDVKNATMIVIFDAYKFGLATLHQLRGRVGRNSYQSYCILVTDKDSKRLNIMESVSDGFTLAQEDLKLRGHGDLFGVKQSGDMSFKLANITKDYDILLNAKKDSDEVLDNIDNYEVLKNILKENINMD